MTRLPKTVVVPLDGSDYAERALGPAKALATRLGVGIGAVRVVDKAESVDDDYLAGVARTHGIDWFVTEVHDEPAAGIRSVVDQREGIVCMATHGHGRATAVFGSTAEQLLAASPDPVVVVGRGVDPTRVRRIDRVVVALDGSAEAETVCGPAIEWARELNLVVNLVTVAGEPMTALREGEEPRRAFGPADPEAYIADALRRHQADGVDVAGEVIVDPISPASGLRQLLRDVPHAAVAMATHGRTGMQRVIHGSVAGSILDESPVPAVMFSRARGEA